MQIIYLESHLESPFLQHEYVEEISNEFFAGNYAMLLFLTKTIGWLQF